MRNITQNPGAPDHAVTLVAQFMHVNHRCPECVARARAQAQLTADQIWREAWAAGATYGLSLAPAPVIVERLLSESP